MRIIDSGCLGNDVESVVFYQITAKIDVLSESVSATTATTKTMVLFNGFGCMWVGGWVCACLRVCLTCGSCPGWH